MGTLGHTRLVSTAAMGRARIFLCLYLPTLLIASPVPGGGSGLLLTQGKLANEDGSKSLSSLFKAVNGFINKTGNFLTKIADATDNQELRDFGDMMKMEEDDSFIRMFMDDETAERVVRGFQKFLEQMPSMKSNLTDVLKGVPELKDMIAEKLANAPQKEDIKDQVNNFLDDLELPESEGVDMFRETLNEHIDMFPDNSEMMDMINEVVDQIPTDEEFNDNMDEFSNNLESIVDELAGPAAAA